MNETFRVLCAISALLAMLVGIPAWAASLYYLVRISRSTIHGETAWRRPNSIFALFRWHPFNAVFDASKLTPPDLIYRRRLFISALLFVVPILAAFVFRVLAR